MSDLQAVFIIGAPRSGTSGTAWALAQHPELWTSAESDWMWFLFGSGRLRQSYARGTMRGEQHWLTKEGVSFEEWAEAVGSGVDGLYRSRSGGKIWIEQSPSYTPLAADLASLFPRSRFVHLVRRGDQVVRSLLASGFKTPAASSFEGAVKAWAAHAAAGRAFHERDPERCIEIRHANLVEHPDETVTQVLDFLGLSHSDAPAAFLRKGAVNSSFQRTEPGSVPSSADRPLEEWTDEEREHFESVAGAQMREFGFD